MPVIKFALIGCGYVSSFYIESFKSKYKKKFEIIGSFDINKENAIKFSNFYKCKNFLSLNDIIKEKPNIVLILTSIDSHYKLSKYFLENKISVYCEKPPVEKLDEYKNLIDIASKNDLKYSFAPCNHLNAQTVFLKRKIESKELGSVKHIHINYKAGINIENKPWKWINIFGSKWPAYEEFKQGVFKEHILYILRILVSLKKDTPHKIKILKSCDLVDKKIVKNAVYDNYIINLIYDDFLVRLELGLFFEKKMFIKVYLNEGYIFLENIRNEKLPIYLFKYKIYKNIIYKILVKVKLNFFDRIFFTKKSFRNLEFNQSKKNVDYFNGINNLMCSDYNDYNKIKIHDEQTIKMYFDLKNL